MNFLQPILLWGLPLVLLPVLIHLFNRLRHRPMPWAAMMFLRSATRKSTRYARLKQLLILLCRVLAVFALIMALSRPLAGGWMGWLTAAAPDTILVLLDRSASMRAPDPGGPQSKLEKAARLIAQTGGELSGQSRVVLIDSVTLEPREIESAALLPELPWTRPTDTAADMPALAQAALDWMTKVKPGSVEIWIASDLQRGDWDPESDRWPALVSALAELPQAVRVRLLACNRDAADNLTLFLREARRGQAEGTPVLDLVFDVEREGERAVALPLTLLVAGQRSEVELKLTGRSTRFRHRVPLGAAEGAHGGWGTMALPADGNPTDNEAYFAFGAPVPLRAAVWARDAFARDVLRLAAAPDPRETNRVSEVISPSQLGTMDWSRFALVLWQDDLPEGGPARALEDYVQNGGTLLLFPPGAVEAGMWEGQPWGWGGKQAVEGSGEMLVERWDREDGPLSDTEEGLELPLRELAVRQRQALAGEVEPLAVFQDGTPVLGRRLMGRGQVLLCSTLPRPDWSRLHEGDVLVPLLQRLMETGGQRLGSARMLACGDPVPAEAGHPWQSMLPDREPEPGLRAGVYRSGGHYLAVNRPEREQNWERVSAGRVRELFQKLPLRLFEEKESGPAPLQSELWRWFLIAMLLLLVGEGVLILPDKPDRKSALPLIPEVRAGSKTTSTRTPQRAA